jgi:hypothetical protein
VLGYLDDYKGSMMYSPIVKGTPYISMIYFDATPLIFGQRSLSADPIVDESSDNPQKLVCGQGNNTFSKTPVLVQREIRLQFAVSDMTWLVFVSEPTEFVCTTESNIVNPIHYKDVSTPPVVSNFILKATSPMKRGE